MTNRIIPYIIVCIPIILQGQSLQSDIESYLETVMESAAAPGLTVSIVKEGEILYEAAYGVANIDHPIPLQIDDALPIGSLTKSFTALAIMQLVQSGSLNLDTSITAYLPWFRTANPVRSNRISTRMLLNHTSGLSGGLIDHNLSGDEAIHALVKSLKSTYLDHDPGSLYSYSNTGYVVAGYLVKALTGQSYTAYLEEHIFRPLGMSRTSTRSSESDRSSHLFGHHPGIKSAISAHHDQISESAAYSPAGSMTRSTARDLGLYMLGLFRAWKDDNQGMLASKYVGQLWHRQAQFPGISYHDGGDGKFWSYGLGWMIGTIEGQTLIFHGGSTGRTSSMMLIDTTHRIGVAVLFNLDYTLIDPYKYQTALHITNNILRLSRGDTLSQFAQPRIIDPTINTFELNQSEINNYTGEYQFAGGWSGDFTYYGINMRIIQNGEKELMGEMMRGSRTLSRFALDFVNPQLAIRRYQARPDAIRFKLDTHGKVLSCSVFGSKLVRKDEDFHEKIQVLNHPSDAWTCLLSREYKVDWTTKYLIASDSKSSIHYLESGEPIEKILQDLFPDATLIIEGEVQQTKLGSGLWKQASYSDLSQIESQQYLALSCTYFGTKHHFILSCPFGALSRIAGKDLYLLMTSMQFALY